MKAFNRMTALHLIVCFSATGLFGCGREVKLNPSPIAVTGKVSQSGRPISDLMIVFQPLGDGHLRELPIQNDGSFRGDLVCGEYAYYVARPAGARPAATLAKLSPKYYQADLSRTISVEPGAQLAIALD